MSPSLKWLLAAACAVATAAAHAHDLWIEPSRFNPKLDEAVELRVRVGENLVGEPVPYYAAQVRQFFVEDAIGRRRLASRDGADPSARFHAARIGEHVIALHSGPFALTLPAEKFVAYLREEGLESIEAWRNQRGLGSEPGREVFSRCAKSLLNVGPVAAAAGDRFVGLPLELLAERNPHLLAGGQRLPVRLTWQGRPLAGALVVAINSLDASLKQAARSDADGRVHFDVKAGGMWLIKAVHMVPASRGYDADWASWWASLTFESRPSDLHGR